MKLLSGRMCEVVKRKQGWSLSVYPATNVKEVIEILNEWVHTNPQDAGVPFALSGIEGNKKC